MSTETTSDSSTPQELLGPNARKPVTIKGFLRDPKNMRYLLIFSAVINVLLLCAVIANAGRGNTPAPTPIVTPTVAKRPTPSPFITEAPDEKTARLRECFNNCEARDFLNLVKEELALMKDFKQTGDYIDTRNNTCYGFYSEWSGPSNKYTGYFEPSTCGGSAYTAKTTEYRVGDKVYLRAGSGWGTATISPAGQTDLVNAVDIIQAQQNINSSYEQRGADRVRVLTAESEKVNQFNQLVKTMLVLKVNERYQLAYFYQEEEKAFKQNIQYLDYGVTNKIQAPQ